jgi:hypothetical protein
MNIGLANVAALFLLLATTQTVGAVAPDECEQQRARYPKNWNDVSRERLLFTCTSHYSGSLRIMIGETDRGGRALMSLVPLKGHGPEATQDPTRDVYRIWLDREQARRLKAGHYFATILRQRDSCWIRGALGTGKGESDQVFFMDNVNPAADRPKEAGSFYNKAPRFSVFAGDAYSCEASK